jgi:hypothetical protein
MSVFGKPKLWGRRPKRAPYRPGEYSRTITVLRLDTGDVKQNVDSGVKRGDVFHKLMSGAD